MNLKKLSNWKRIFQKLIYSDVVDSVPSAEEVDARISDAIN